MRAVSLILLLLITPLAVQAAVESVYVQKVLTDDDRAIILRSNGDGYLIEKGVGCLSLWRYEGKRVYISSQGMFLGIGSDLLIPGENQKCHIWDSHPLGSGLSTPTAPIPGPQSSANAGASSAQPIGAIQRALKILGYDVPTNGIADEATKAAVAKYQRTNGQTATDYGLKMTLLSLALDLLNRQPPSPDALGLSAQLYRAATGSTKTSSAPSCEDGHWVSSVMDSGKLVKLEDNSIWEIDAVDSIDSALWLPTETILVCGGTLINSDSGDKVRAKRLK